MKEKSYIILYDITISKYRRELVKILDSYGYRIQYSAYIVHLSESRVSELKGKIKQFAKPKLLNKNRKLLKILVIPLCKICYSEVYSIELNDFHDKEFLIL